MGSRRISRDQFLSYLEKLARGEPVREPMLLRAIEQYRLNRDDLLSGAERQHVKGELVTYSGINFTTLLAWRDALGSVSTSCRVGHAVLGDSHNARVSGAMVTVRSVRRPHPYVVLVDTLGEISMPPDTDTAARLVLVENLENFLDLAGTLGLLPACGLGPEWQDADILFGSGNGITNHLLTPLFQQYREIGCLFDPDLGGVRMCDTLYQRGDLPPLHFLAPADLPARLEASLRTIGKDQREQLAMHMRRSPPCAHVGGLIYTTGKHLEQETYLVSSPSIAESPNESGL